MGKIEIMICRNCNSFTLEKICKKCNAATTGVKDLAK